MERKLLGLLFILFCAHRVLTVGSKRRVGHEAEHSTTPFTKLAKKPDLLSTHKPVQDYVLTTGRPLEQDAITSTNHQEINPKMQAAASNAIKNKKLKVSSNPNKTKDRKLNLRPLMTEYKLRAKQYSSSQNLSDSCIPSIFQASWEEKNGNVSWAYEGHAAPGTLSCREGYVFNGTSNLVYCPYDTTDYKYKTVDPKAKCRWAMNVNYTDVPFHGLSYKFQHITVGSKTTSFPVLFPNTSYIITTDYNASKTTPTIRVRVGLVGKAHKPVLVNIQQSTESVGFELPMKVVGKGSQELAVNYSTTLREMCTSKNLSTVTQERVIVTVVSQEPKVHIHNENFSDPEIWVSFHEAQDAQRPLNDVLHKKAKPNEDQWFFFNWEDAHPSVHFLVVNITSETKQCATVRIRNSSCSVYKENIKEFDHGQYLTMTTRAAVVVPRDQFPEVFYLSVLAETDDTPCGLPGNLTGRGRIKPYQFNIHKHHESAGFLFLPVLVIPICSILFILGSLYIKCNDVLRTSSTSDRDRAGTVESLNAPAEIHTQNGGAELCTEGLVTVGEYDVPHTRVDLIPVILTLIVLPVFLDILSTRVERYQKFGDLDACTFNIECSFPYGPFPDIGRAVTCSSYTLMGVTFLLLLFTHHRKYLIKNNPDLVTGVRHDYDIFRAIAYCLISQGVIGFVYHVCPNENVESLSDLFVLIAIAYSCQKIHQNRHPDVRHQVFHPLYVTVFCIGLHGVLNMFVHRETVVTWVLFGALHLLHIVVVPLQFVLLDSLEISFHPVLIYRRLPLLGMKFSKICGVQRVVGVVGTLLNLVVMLCSVILQPPNFMVYLLSTFSVNMVLYLLHYVLMKSVHYKEKITHTHVGLALSVVLVWLVALYYLVFHTSIAPGIAPALSRESAKPCVVWEMFDGHDAWHFFSAFALFLSNFLVMIVDDCQAGTQTSHLHVF